MNSISDTQQVTTESSVSFQNKNDLSGVGVAFGCISAVFCMVRSTKPELEIATCIGHTLCGYCCGTLANQLLDTRIIIEKQTKTVVFTQQPNSGNTWHSKSN